MKPTEVRTVDMSSYIERRGRSPWGLDGEGREVQTARIRLGVNHRAPALPVSRLQQIINLITVIIK